jgi:CRISP-associated protein Cas1
MPVLGIHHSNKLNPFCLVDDLIEPFRPFVDRKVEALFCAPSVSFDVICRRSLLEVLYEQVCIGGKSMTLTAATSEFTYSFVRALRAKNPSALEVPTLIEPNAGLEGEL